MPFWKDFFVNKMSCSKKIYSFRVTHFLWLFREVILRMISISSNHKPWFSFLAFMSDFDIATIRTSEVSSGMHMVGANYFLRFKNVHSYSIMSTSNFFYAYHRISSSFLLCMGSFLVYKMDMDNLTFFS